MSDLIVRDKHGAAIAVGDLLEFVYGGAVHRVPVEALGRTDTGPGAAGYAEVRITVHVPGPHARIHNRPSCHRGSSQDKEASRESAPARLQETQPATTKHADKPRNTEPLNVERKGVISHGRYS